jgi:hypothetical protein
MGQRIPTLLNSPRTAGKRYAGQHQRTMAERNSILPKLVRTQYAYQDQTDQLNAVYDSWLAADHGHRFITCVVLL